MDMWTLHASISVLMAIAMTAQSANHLAPQAVYQKLEHALITDSKVVYLMQNTFFPSQGSPQVIVVVIGVNVTVDSMMPGSCDEQVTLCEVALCEVTLCEVTLCEVTLCEVALCEVTLCEVTLCVVTLH